MTRKGQWAGGTALAAMLMAGLVAGPAGAQTGERLRQLERQMQEMQREMNTLGSKVRDTDVVRHVLELKSELERVREQIQNIE